MIDDREIWACANLLLKQHGDQAWFVAAQRADELLARGEMRGHSVYLRIIDRIRQLETQAPAGAVH
ncbi:hypothetical protein FPZ54_03435 [Sphingomonas suaedae]|uniref:Uncharacterized protein n=1 Tax=Sphingomonas suaedae TaxID=2599297 RepID=A0A518RCR1_9SPHN|nr:hypothetical protein [Sphingomonas suaedae]QDX25171.1 hypothetical protein FPZ54_03435 [Sphingomonas suaedae]